MSHAFDLFLTVSIHFEKKYFLVLTLQYEICYYSAPLHKLKIMEQLVDMQNIRVNQIFLIIETLFTVENQKQGNSKLESTSSKLIRKSPAKRSDDPIHTYNRCGSLNNMESEGTTSAKLKRK